MVHKEGVRWRTVTDLSQLDRLIEITGLMETMASVLAAVVPDQWMTSIDLTDAYSLILIAVCNCELRRLSSTG